MGRTGRARPKDRVGGWPDRVADEPETEVARLLAVAVRTVLEQRGLSLRAASELTEVGYTSIGDLLRGQAWPDLVTIARLEAGLGVDLWPAGVARESAALGLDAGVSESTTAAGNITGDAASGGNIAEDSQCPSE